MSERGSASRDGADEFVRSLPLDNEINAGIERFGARPVLDAVVRALEEPDCDGAARALGLVRDAIQLARHRELRAEYHRSDLLVLLRSKLLAPEYSIRGSVITTLGRLGPRQNAHHLREALPWYIEHDPLRLDHLLFEISWLGRHRVDRRQLLTDVVTSRPYLARWMAVQILWNRDLNRGRFNRGAGRTPGWALQLMRRLAQDRNLAVRGDARHALDERRRHGPERPRSGPNRSEAVRRRTPDRSRLRVERFETLVDTYLYCSGESDYDVDLVEAIGLYVDGHAITSGQDPFVYWEPLAEARRSSPARP